ncbi:hypothetical protein ACFVT5_14190 [Streptomyces sp. NPDC058001]
MRSTDSTSPLTFLRSKRDQARRFARSGPISLGLPVFREPSR